jgi:hypothetical protein
MTVVKCGAGLLLYNIYLKWQRACPSREKEISKTTKIAPFA